MPRCPGALAFIALVAATVSQASCAGTTSMVTATEGRTPETVAGDTTSGGPSREATALHDWSHLAEPGPVHERMAYFVGDWRFHMSRVREGPEPEVSEGTVHCELILGGRYLRAETKSATGNALFEGLGISGYDNVTGEHFNLWLDNASTGVMISRGRMDEDETLLLTGEFADPNRGEVPYRMRTTVTGPDSYTLEMFMTFPPSDREQRVMEAKYTRVKS